MDNGEIDVAGSSDIGRARRTNEDRYAVAALHSGHDPWRRGHGVETLGRRVRGVGKLGPVCPPGSSRAPQLMVVADGVGGAPGGDVASGAAVLTVTTHMLDAVRSDAWLDADAELLRAAEAAQASVCQLSQTDPALGDMRTTLTAALVHRDHLQVVHAGDSRCYVFRRGERPVQITHDHTLAQWQLDAGFASDPDEARVRFGHMLTNAIGGSVTSEVDLEWAHCRLRPGDVVLVCSDGLTRHLSDDRMAELLERHPAAMAACRALVADANAQGGEDNITAVVARLSEAGPLTLRR